MKDNVTAVGRPDRRIIRFRIESESRGGAAFQVVQPQIVESCGRVEPIRSYRVAGGRLSTDRAQRICRRRLEDSRPAGLCPLASPAARQRSSTASSHWTEPLLMTAAAH